MASTQGSLSRVLQGQLFVFMKTILPQYVTTGYETASF